MINLKIQLDEKNIEITNEAKTVYEIFKDEIEKNDLIIACNCNNEIKSLNYIPKENDKITFVDLLSRDGRRIYIRGLLYIMSMAFHECYPEAYLNVNYQLTNAMYCEVDNMEVTKEMISKVESKMKEIVKRDILQLDNNQKDGVSLYFCEDYYNYFYGAMPISTGYIKIFEALKYNDGFLLRYPSKENPYALEKGTASKKLVATLDEYEDIHDILNINTLYKLNTAIEEKE